MWGRFGVLQYDTVTTALSHRGPAHSVLPYPVTDVIIESVQSPTRPNSIRAPLEVDL